MELLMLTGERTTLYPITRREVELFDRDIMNKIQAWRFFSSDGLNIKKHDGKTVSYQGLKFEGSPERVFWYYFQPFFKYEIPKILNIIYDECISKKLVPDIYIAELFELLKVMVNRLWNEIAITHQLLKGEGFPKKNDLKDVTGIIESTIREIDDEIQALLLKGDLTKDDDVKLKEDILDLKPNFFGIGFNINALLRKIKK